MREYAALHTLPTTVMKKRSDIEGHILPAFRDMRVANIRPKHVAEFQARLWGSGAGMSAQSVANIVSALSQVCKYALIKGLIEINPCAGVTRTKRLKRQPSFWSMGEQRTVF